MVQTNEKKICKSCYRYFEYRKKWKLVWDDVKYCSDKCRKNKLSYKDYACSVQLKLYIRSEHPKKIYTKALHTFIGVENKNTLSTIIRELYINKVISVFNQKGKKVSPLLEKGPFYIGLSQ